MLAATARTVARKWDAYSEWYGELQEKWAKEQAEIGAEAWDAKMAMELRELFS